MQGPRIPHSLEADPFNPKHCLTKNWAFSGPQSWSLALVEHVLQTTAGSLEELELKIEGVRLLAALVRDDYDVAKFVLESEDDKFNLLKLVMDEHNKTLEYFKKERDKGGYRLAEPVDAEGKGHFTARYFKVSQSVSGLFI